MRCFTLLIIFVLLFPKSLLSQENPVNQLDEHGRKTGYWITFYPGGKVKYEGYFVNDMPVGEFKRYYPGGILQAEMIYSEDSGSAYARLYYENGKPAAEGRYLDKNKDSTWNYYSMFDGQLIMKENYKEGRREGESLKFYSNKNVSERIVFVNDERNGVWEQFFSDGTLRLRGHYQNNNREGEFNSWTGNGNPSISGHYYNGVMHGRWTYYDEKGEVEIVVEYNNGIMIPDKEYEKKQDEFSRRVQESIGNYSEPELFY